METLIYISLILSSLTSILCILMLYKIARKTNIIKKDITLRKQEVVVIK